MRSITLSKRLLSASEFVRQGAYFADIGTDHAYLPIFLLGEGKISRAVCADINEGPLLSAKKNAEVYGCSEKMEFVLTDGAKGLSGKGITDYGICGMGGELIADIIDRSPHLKDAEIRLVLQPMSRQGILRRYLYANGFNIILESYTFDSGKYYICFAAEYTGECRDISDFEAEFGKVCPREEFSPEKRGYFTAKLHALKKSVNGKKLGGEECFAEENLLSMLTRILEE